MKRKLMYHVCYREMQYGEWCTWRAFTGWYPSEAEAQVEANRFLLMRSNMGINTEVIIVSMVHPVSEEV